jgi:hypothetical protein
LIETVTVVASHTIMHSISKSSNILYCTIPENVYEEPAVEIQSLSISQLGLWEAGLSDQWPFKGGEPFFVMFLHNNVL